MPPSAPHNYTQESSNLWKSASNFYRQYLARPRGLTSGRKYLEECESIRGWAILLVLLYHWVYQFVPLEPINTNPLLAYVYAGRTGVILFYVLSAFLLSIPWFRGNSLSVHKFYSNRFLRIMPMYLCAVVFAAIYTGDYWKGLMAALFLDLDLFTLYPFGSVWGTLAIEVQFYLILPLIMTCVRIDRWRFLGLLMLALMTLVSLLFYLLPGGFSLSLGSLGIANVFAAWPAFLVGIICAFLFVRFDARSIKRSLQLSWWGKGGGDLMLFAVIFAMGMYLKATVAAGILVAQVNWPIGFVLESIFWGLLLLALVCVPSRFEVLFVNPVMSLLGVLSFSIYLIHGPLLFFSMRVIKAAHPSWLESPGWPLAAASLTLFIATIALSSFTYICIERPFIAIKAKK